MNFKPATTFKYFPHEESATTFPELVVETESNGVRHYITPEGVKLPSVTTVLGHFKKESLQKWEDRVGQKEAEYIKRRAGVRGNKFHKLMELYLMNDLYFSGFPDGLMPDMKQAFYDMQPVLDRIGNIWNIEAPLYSHSLGLAGRTDLVAVYDGAMSIIDFKTSLKPKREEWITNYFEQGTAYALMYEERTNIPIKQVVVIISVDGDNHPQLFVKNKEDYIPSLANKIALYKKEVA